MKNKLLLFTFLFAFSIVLNAQTSSKRDPQFQVDYEMHLKKEGSSIMVSTFKSPSEQDKSLVLLTSASSCDNLKGVRIRLENGENLFFNDAIIECLPFMPSRPNVKGKILLTPQLEAQLDGHEIVEFTLGSIRTPVQFKENNENLRLLLKWVKDESGF